MIVKAPTLKDLSQQMKDHPELTFRKPLKLRDGNNNRTYWITFGVKTLDKKTG